MTEKFCTSICVNSLDRFANMLLKPLQSYKCESAGLLLYEIDPCKPREMVHEYHHVYCTTCGGDFEWSCQVCRYGLPDICGVAEYFCLSLCYTVFAVTLLCSIKSCMFSALSVHLDWIKRSTRILCVSALSSLPSVYVAVDSLEECLRCSDSVLCVNDAVCTCLVLL